MTTREGELVNRAIYWFYRHIASELRSSHYISSSEDDMWVAKFQEMYSKDALIRELGKSTVLVEIPTIDFEVLFIGGREKFFRVGSALQVCIADSKPIELARGRVQERLNELSKNLVLTTASEGFEDTDINGVPIDYVRNTETGETWEQEDIVYLPQFVPEGKALLNRNKDHYAWIRAFNRTTSIDEDLYSTLQGLGMDFNECVGCGTPISKGRLCPVCLTKYEECTDCGSIEPVEKGEYRDGGFLCSKCKEKPRCRGCGYPIKNGGEGLCERCGKIRGILDYHSHIGRQNESDGSRFKVGIEIEKEDYEVRDNLNCRAILRDTGWVVERDSSLGEGGFEMISPIYPLDIDIIKKKTEPLRKYISCKTSVRCGGHIHVSDTERTPHEILLDIRGYLPLLYGLYPNRATNEYCEAKETPEYIQQGHRQALNITDRTLEFRIFPAVKNIEQLVFRLKLVEYMLKHKEVDVVKVGEALLDENSELYNLLRQRINKENLKIRAKAFIDFTNYLDRDALVIEGNKIKRVISVPKIKLDKEKAFEENVKVIAEEFKANNFPRPRVRRTISPSEFGYFANLIEKEQ